MNEYHQIKVLEMGIIQLQNIRSDFLAKMASAKGQDYTALATKVDALNEKISALVDKRIKLIVNTSCNIAGVTPEAV
jgi:hypothetical protein